MAKSMATGVLLFFIFSGFFKTFGQIPETLLPVSTDFHLTFAVDAHSKLPLGPNCEGFPPDSLNCLALTFTVENIGTHIVRISGLTCANPNINVEQQEPHSTSGWWPVSNGTRNTCRNIDFRKNPPGLWTDRRMRPGAKMRFSARMLASLFGYPFKPGQYTLRAGWSLHGCIDRDDKDDCLRPLQVVNPGSSISEADALPYISLVSNTIMVTAPPVPTYADPKIEITASATLMQPTDDKSGKCVATLSGSIDCILLHYTVRNLSDKPIRLGHMTCSDSSQTPQFRAPDGTWTALKSTLMACTMNFMVWDKLQPNELMDRTTTLRHAGAGFDINPLREAGNYDVRLAYHPEVCVASRNGEQCVSNPDTLPVVYTDAVHFQTTSTLPQQKLWWE